MKSSSTPSLCVLLPVHDVQTVLWGRVVELLEVLPEVTPDFEVLIVDDGSVDQSDETAYELSLSYPQVRHLRLPKCEGEAAAIAWGMNRTQADIVIVHDIRQPLRPGDIGRLWQLREDEDLVIARPVPTSPPVPRIEGSLIQRLIQWSAAVQKHASAQTPSTGIQLIRRQALVGVQAELAGRKFTHRDIHSTEMAGQPSKQRPQKPNLLRRMREFALGE